MSSVTWPNGQTFASSALSPDGFNVLMQPLVASILGIDPVANPNAAYKTVRVAWQTQGQPEWAVDEDVCVVRSTLKDTGFSRTHDNIRGQNDSTSLADVSSFTQVWNFRCVLYGPNSADKARLILSAIREDWAAQWIVSPITDCSVVAPGINYQVGDVVGVVQPGAFGGSLKVTSLGLNGAVAGLALVPAQQGYGYQTTGTIAAIFDETLGTFDEHSGNFDEATQALSTTGGSGTGLTVNIVASNVFLVPGPRRPTYSGEPFKSLWFKRADIEIEFNELVIESLINPSAAGLDIVLLKDTGLSTTLVLRP